MSFPPFQSHSATSLAAAREIETITHTLRAKVYVYLIGCGPLRELVFGGAIDEEIQIALNMPGNTERPRRRELEQEGWVIDSLACRPTRSGRLAVIWIARVHANLAAPPTLALWPESRSDSPLACALTHCKAPALNGLPLCRRHAGWAPHAKLVAVYQAKQRDEYREARDDLLAYVEEIYPVIDE